MTRLRIAFAVVYAVSAGRAAAGILARPTVSVGDPWLSDEVRRIRESPALGFGTGLGPCESAATQPGQVRALVLGVDHVRDAPPLEGSINDVRLVARAIRRRAPNAHIVALEDPKAEDMAVALRRLVDATRCRDFVVFHFSGREGVYPSRELGRDDLVLVAKDGSMLAGATLPRGERGAALSDELTAPPPTMDPATQGLRGKDLAAAVIAMRNRGAFVMVSLDTCRAGVLRLRVAVPEPAWRWERDAPLSPAILLPGAGGMASILAADSAHLTFERKFGDQVQGALSYALASALDAGVETVRALADKVRDALGADATPVFESTDPDRKVLAPENAQAQPSKVAQPAAPGPIRLIRPASKGSKIPGATDLDVEGEAPEADRLRKATVNDVTAAVEGRRFMARVKLPPGKQHLTIYAYDDRARLHSETFDVEVPDAESKVRRGKNYAILIANGRYENWPSLNSPRIDAEALHDVLEASYGFEATSFKVGSREVRLQLFDATRDAILETLEDVSGTLGDDDELLVFYGGHGYKPADEAFWVPSNAARPEGARLTSFVGCDDIARAISRSNARHILVISDSCRSGKMCGGQSKAEPPPGPNPYDEKYEKGILQVYRKGQSRYAFTSGADEDVPDTGAGGHSHFVARILDVLGKPSKSAFQGSMLKSWIQANVAGESGQVPQYFAIPKSKPKKDPAKDDPDGGDFIFFYAPKLQ
jgi:hypothetical protein